MALFELENGRLVPAQFGREVPDGFTADVLQAVRSQVLEIVSRPLFPIAWEGGTGSNDDAPRLTALDAAGQVVAVEVVELLDADGLINALSRLADSAAMSWTDLAHHYPRGIEGFKEGWARFRESMPTSPPNGPRMILVAAQIAPDVRPALDVLSSSGVEVHEMSLRETTNGRAFLEVDPVGQRLYNHRFTPVVESANPVPALAATSRKSRRTDAAEGDSTPDVLERRRRHPSPRQDSGAVGAQAQGETPAPRRSAQATSTPAPQEGASTKGTPTGGFPSRASRWSRREKREEIVFETVSPMPTRRSRREHARHNAGVAGVGRDAAGLRALARMLGSDVTLSLQPAARTPSGALLSLEGQIVVPAGVFSDPSLALRACGFYGEDGWTAWHLGDDRGPSLGESIDEVNRSQ